jgi:hypothetical protein
MYKHLPGSLYIKHVRSIPDFAVGVVARRRKRGETRSWNNLTAFSYPMFILMFQYMPFGFASRHDAGATQAYPLIC